MLAMKRPSSESFNKAIEACSEAGMIHLEAMARERCAKFLFGVNNEVLAKDHLTVSYWLYQEWGAHAKALQMSQQYDFLKVSQYLMFIHNSKYVMLSHKISYLFSVPEEMQEEQCKEYDPECYCALYRE